MANSANKIRLIWIEEQEIFQKLYKAIFTTDSPIEVLGALPFIDFKSLPSAISKLCPELLLVGCKSASSENLEILAKVQADFPGTGIILLVSYLKYADILALKQFIENSKSPFGFVFKKTITSTEQLFSILSLIKMGQNVIDSMLTDLMTTDKEKTSVARGLTPREIEILNLISKGYTNVSISENLCIDVKTVRHHINNIYSKLKISDEFDNKHPRVSATNVFLRITGQLAFDDNFTQE